MSRVQCLSGCSEVDGNFELKNGFISRTRMPRVPACFGHFGPKIPGKIISPTFYLHNTGVCSTTEMQFRPARPRARPARDLLRTPDAHLDLEPYSIARA